MKDIRIITRKGISPSKPEVCALLGSKSQNDRQKMDIDAIYERLLPSVKRYISPKAAIAVWQQTLYVMLTLGGGISRLIEKYTAKEDMLSAMVLDAMADSSLFAFEEQLLPVLQQICRTEEYGIAGRLEIPGDVPMEKQKEAYEVLDAGRTLGLTMTNGYMLNPVKSMCLLFALSKDMTCRNIRHDCGKCDNKDCLLRKEPEILLQIENNKTISCPKGSNLLDVLQRNGIMPPAHCGGKGKCGKCGIVVQQGNLPITAEDRAVFTNAEVQKGMRLSCQAVLQENLKISIRMQSEKEFAVLAGEQMENLQMHVQNTQKKGVYGIAIDIGTTTLAFALLELQSGKIVDTYTMVNSQRCFGTDVISRIEAANTGKEEQLCLCIKEDIRKGIAALLEKNRSAVQKPIEQIAIAANTVMLHLLQGYSCEGFQSYPFAPETLEIEEVEITRLFPEMKVQKPWAGLSEMAKITLLPGISAFVGADITAGIFVSGMQENKENSFLLDLGTNGEMALKINNRIFVASTAAGPAFEGGSSKWGMGSVPGAIAKVTIENGKSRVETIQEKSPKGICGTGVIEAVAELLKAGLIDETGKLADPYFTEGYPLASTKQGETIRFTQQDIREIQMAKAAIRAGIEILLMHADIRYEEIDRVYLAGGFGFYLDVKKAAEIGLLPVEFTGKTAAAGNTALKGAEAFLIKDTAKEKMQKIIESAEEIPLALEEKFEELYIQFMKFEKIT